MTGPHPSEEALGCLAAAYPELQFDDAERRAVLLEMGTRDINAAPGSGKTTILAAKLLLLARQWPHSRRGVCVISHTNVARDEVQRRLAATVDGVRLLSYPHFIGTIHAFVNQFLALPFLRSNGLEVDVIDNDAFARRAVGMARRDNVLRFWMEKNQGVEDMVSTLSFAGANLELTSAKPLPNKDSKSYPRLEAIKNELTAKGVFRFEDMFAFAESLVRDSPAIRQRLSHRFPLLFIDEMQDTSWDQEELLDRLFDETVVMQRYGDINQRILGSASGAEKLTFPQNGFISISTSKRFGPAIAHAVASVQYQGAPVAGERPPDPPSPTLILYDEKLAQKVIPQFGRLVLATFTDEELGTGSVNALCSRKRGDSKSAPGRHLADYWPAFANDASGISSRPTSVWHLLSDVGSPSDSSYNLNGRAADVRRALLLVLRSAKSPLVADIRDGPQLLRTLERGGAPTDGIRRLCRDLALARQLTGSAEKWSALPPLLFPVLSPLLPEGMSLEEFTALNAFAIPDVDASGGGDARRCTVEHEGRSVTIRVGTVASMKGETHLATLVLESHGGLSKRFDLEEALPVLAGEPLDPKASALLKGQFRSLYVAMSRPSRMLCLAMNKSRAAQLHIDALTANGWQVVHVV